MRAEKRLETKLKQPLHKRKPQTLQILLRRFIARPLTQVLEFVCVEADDGAHAGFRCNLPECRAGIAESGKLAARAFIHTVEIVLERQVELLCLLAERVFRLE